MRNPEADAARMAERKNHILRTAFGLFSEKNIASVTMAEIAAATYGNTTLHRYFSDKQSIVIATATWAFEEYRLTNSKRLKDSDWNRLTAAEQFEFYLDSFLNMYRNNKNLLRFNQFFNIYVKGENLDDSTLKPYKEMILNLKSNFNVIYEKAKSDKTLRTDISAEQIFSTSLHLMLATVTRYAVGLVYIPEDGFEPENDLLILKNALMNEYVC